MIHFAIYVISTGVILQIGSCPRGMFEYQIPSDPTKALIEISERLHIYYVDVSIQPHAVIEKIPHPLTVDKTTLTADGVDEVVISNITNPSTIIWPDGQEDEITDGEARFSVDLEGNYTLKIISFTQLTEEIQLEAVSAT